MNGLATRIKLRATNHVPRELADLGLPNLREQRRREAIARWWRRGWRIGTTIIVVGLAFSLGYNTRLAATEAKRRAEIVQDLGWKRLAMTIPQGKRKCAVEWSEGCLVCIHRALGGTVKSTMC